ncbi:PEP/pyruvate-binding domain-containing protein [Pseudonocardia hydrocarbonoxydans]|uniref:Phosphoenolpyruvate synthase n=1 Tax=Pseudonocardia hydrocarbonoxydans TaxID=76726 RepID=A0A4Y3WHF3_9PSEU|nr:PEP/pyruvate-binding domain-containing protein [Pseudonocardia hydrocarbonoxydans]GEC18392.1 phosphoenolpyruvate synthase [Pseudonocardia hydrocarbonoxydans]
MPTVLGLAHAADAARTGGKAAHLAALLAAGFPVPDGFCVTTGAYARVATGVPTGGPDLAARARAALLAATVPADVATQVRAAYAALGADVPVAVRSSATAEDLPDASSAGQQDTFLHVVGADAVLDAVRRCWASLWTDRAVSYRTEAGIDHGTVALAVVVQRMVDAEVAGVLFTADPVSGRRTRTVIDAAPGLGEAVVSGAVNPDHVVVDGGGVDADGVITEHRIGDKAVAVRGVAGGGTERVAATAPERACLSDDQVHALVAVGRRVEAHLGTPQDVEWAIDGEGTVWLTQSRPITTLYPQPPDRGPGLRVYFCVSLAQGLTAPITPMGMSGFRVIAAAVAGGAFGAPVADPTGGPPALVQLGGRAFVEVTEVLRSRVGRALVPRVLDVMEARSAVVLRGLSAEPDLAVRPGTVLPVVRGLARVLARFRVPPVVALSLACPAAGRRRVDRLGARLRARTAVPAGLPAPARLDHVERVLSGIFPVLPSTMPVAAAGFLGLALARRAAAGELDDDATHEVLRSLPHNVTTEMDLELWAAATRIRADARSAAALRGPLPDVLPPVLARELASFLSRHGHRAVGEIDLGVPRWSDDPAHVLGVLANYLRLDDPDRAPDVRFARGARAAETAVARVVDRVRRRSRVRGALVAFGLSRTRQLAGMRETHKDLLVRALAHVRAQLAVIGAELVARGLLDAVDDVYFLELPEARTAIGGADHRALVADRRAAHARELRRRHVPRVLLSDGTEPEALAAPPPDGALVGTPASAGVVTAPARVVLDPVGAHLEPGEILVAPSTDPGWTPLFLTAGGLVMEMGGSNSHGAVVAREYGIPAVVGVADATRRLRTGELVTVDGAAGAITTD